MQKREDVSRPPCFPRDTMQHLSPPEAGGNGPEIFASSNDWYSSRAPYVILWESSRRVVCDRDGFGPTWSRRAPDVAQARRRP